MVVTVTVDWADNGGELSLTVYEDTDTVSDSSPPLLAQSIVTVPTRG